MKIRRGEKEIDYQEELRTREGHQGRGRHSHQRYQDPEF